MADIGVLGRAWPFPDSVSAEIVHILSFYYSSIHLIRYLFVIGKTCIFIDIDDLWVHWLEFCASF